jgi:RNA recognition motif-containing protein
MRLFVGNLSEQVTEAELREHFSAVGPLAFIHLPTHRENGKLRGIAFLEFNDAGQAAEAIRRFHYQPFQGKLLIVNEARARETGTGFRPNPSTRPSSTFPDRVAKPYEAENRPTPRGDARRDFGPDAAPRAQRKSANRHAKSTRAPKGPIRERFSGQFFGVDEDDADSDKWNDEPLHTSQE